MIERFGKEIKKSEKTLGIEFKDKRHIFYAISHPSYANENDFETLFEKYEFLGDSVINFVVTSIIFEKYPDYTEGELTVLRASLVNEEVLAEVSKELGIQELILLGKGVDTRSLKKVLVDSYEATVGAIYLDGGMSKARKFLKQTLGPHMRGEKELPIDFKTRLQEETVKEKGVLPSYRVIKEEGPIHKRKYYVVVEISGKVKGEGMGRSKKQAEQRAAEMALKGKQLK